MTRAALTLGIDTGGTYTDAVLIDQASREVLASAKALTTYDDLSRGIGQAVAAALDGQASAPSDVELVSLSTTLATNAIVEGRGSRVCLILVGYDPELIRKYGFEHELVTQDVVYLRGGHDGDGDEQEPLDEAAAREAILAYRDRVEAFAVSGYFGVRNADHELRVRALVEELTARQGGDPLPVTCGHELTTRLNAVRRATTAALNARLIPLLRELIATVRGTLDAQGIDAPLMVVRGDGSLVRAEWAMRRPIETILSGPAASAIGAWHLAGRRDGWVVDVGGTTTDIAVLRGGHPRLNPEGARVGRWRTMVEAVDVHTVGLGGDSLVAPEDGQRFVVGPRRVVPLCMLADAHPSIVEELRRQQDRPDPLLDGQFALVLRASAPGLSEAEEHLLAELAAGPLPLRALVGRLGYGLLVMRRLQSLEARRLVLRAGFTPTDALHVLGRFRRWDAEASRLGAGLLAATLDLSPQALCERVVEDVSGRVAAEMAAKALADEGAPVDWEAERAAAALLARALNGTGPSALGCRLELREPLVAIGAPAEAYLPRTAAQLHTDVVIPPHAEVANAVGAAVGGVVQRLQVEIRPLDGDTSFRLYLPGGVHEFASLEASVRHAEQAASAWLEAQARLAGTDQVEIHISRVDRSAPLSAGWGEELYLGTELTFTALGRPSPAR